MRRLKSLLIGRTFVEHHGVKYYIESIGGVKTWYYNGGRQVKKNTLILELETEFNRIAKDAVTIDVSTNTCTCGGDKCKCEGGE